MSIRGKIPSFNWDWSELTFEGDTVSGWVWRFEGDHINCLELRAILTTVRWWIKVKKFTGIRILHLTDSLVCLHCLSRGRTSSRKLRRTLIKINAMLLAADLHPSWGYVNTKSNPADKPSRRPFRRKWVRK